MQKRPPAPTTGLPGPNGVRNYRPGRTRQVLRQTHLDKNVLRQEVLRDRELADAWDGTWQPVGRRS